MVSAGLGALDGPQHGAASTLAHRFLAEALADPVAALAERLRTGTPIPGFGHRIYRTRDPRTALVLDHLGDVPVRAAVDAVTARLAGRPGGFPNVDLALAAVMHAHDLRPDAGEAMFADRPDGRLDRPRAGGVRRAGPPVQGNGCLRRASGARRSAGLNRVTR